MQVRAIARNIGHPPRKVRRVTDAIKGRRVNDALAILKFLPNTPAKAVFKVVASAAANAENNYQMDPDDLWVVNAIADEAPTRKKFRARPHGRASRIMMRSTHITVYVSNDRAELPKSVR
ncbi:MAG TPA: 50S ribosomal protein L22 [Ktedonobacterales bacterium]|jgi:large subunit ribosomal protein L22|nr:50S ribosomal protein L22 [Ktedonobacterales bacterium]